MADRKLMWCAEHGEPAWLYSDGSHSCWYDCIVEAITEHTLVELPEIERLRSAFALACGELSGYGPHTNSSPDHLMQELLEEARCG